MRTLEGIRYLINLDSAEIQQNFAGGVAPPAKFLLYFRTIQID